VQIWRITFQISRSNLWTSNESYRQCVGYRREYESVQWSNNKLVTFQCCTVSFRNNNDGGWKLRVPKIQRRNRINVRAWSHFFVLRLHRGGQKGSRWFVPATVRYFRTYKLHQSIYDRVSTLKYYRISAMTLGCDSTYVQVLNVIKQTLIYIFILCIIHYDFFLFNNSFSLYNTWTWTLFRISE